MILARSMKGRPAGVRIAAIQSMRRRPLADRQETRGSFPRRSRLCRSRRARSHPAACPSRGPGHADLKHGERRTLRGIDQRSPERVPPAAIEAGAFPPTRATSRPCSTSDPTFSPAPSSATKATPARPTGTPRERAASLPSSRTRPTKGISRPSSPASSTRPAPASSRASDASSASSASPSDAKRPHATSHQSSASPPALA
jgi:hypothetical protein